MPGFVSSFSNGEDTIFAANADFSKITNEDPTINNGLQTNGQLWIGSTALNAGGTHINVGKITSPLSTLNIGFSAGNITMDVASGSSITITGDSGGGLTGSSFTFTGGTTGLTFAGATSTETLGGTLVVANGGTGDATFTAYSVITAGTTSTGAFQNVVGVGTTGQVLTSNGATELPSWGSPAGGFGPNATIQLKDDFILCDGGTGNVTSELNWTCNSGIGTANWNYLSNSSFKGYPGLIGNASLSSSQNPSMYWLIPSNTLTNNTSIFLGQGALSINWVVLLNTLSNSTNRYVFTCGLATTNSGQTDGIYFSYSDNVNSGDWQGISRAASTSSTANSSTAAVNNAFVNLGITVNAAATSVAFFVNGSQIANSPLTSNIPSVALAPFLNLTRSSGTIAANSIEIDLFYMIYTLTTAR